MLENRRHYRIPFKNKVVLSFAEEIITGTAINISLGGLFVRSLKVKSIDTSCRMLFELEEDNSPVIFHATVKRAISFEQNTEADPGMALQFDKSSPEALQRLKIFLNKAKQNFKVASAILSSGEPDLMTLGPLLKSLSLPESSDVSELRFQVEKILTIIESSGS